MSNSRDIADSAATINFIDTVTSNVQTQLNTLDTAVGNVSVTSGSLTKTFVAGETADINLTSSVLAPVVGVTKEVSQVGVTNNNWDASAGTYTLEDSAPATSLIWAGYGIASAVYSQNFSISSLESSPTGLAFNADGTKMFVVGTSGQNVLQYVLSTGFDVSTASYTSGDFFNVTSQENLPFALAFNTAGTKMYVAGWTNANVNEYNLTTGFDVKTASFSKSFAASEVVAPTGLAFNANGTKMFIVDANGSYLDISEYTLSTGFDVATSSFVDAFSVSAQDTGPQGLSFNPNGTKMFLVGSTNKLINQYNLTTGFDISTASFSNITFSVLSEEASPRGMALNADGTKMFVVGSSGVDVGEYQLPLSLALGTGSFASTDVGKTINANSGVFVLTSTGGAYTETTAPSSYATVASGNWGMFGVVYDATADVLKTSLALGAGYDISVAAYTGNTIGSQAVYNQGVAFNNDGTKMYQLTVVNTSYGYVNEWDLSTPYSLVGLTSAARQKAIHPQDNAATGLAFNTDGTKMFILGIQNTNIYVYNLSTAFLVTSATYSSSASLGSVANPRGLHFSPDGTNVYMVDLYGNVVSFPLSTGFDISTIGSTPNNFGAQYSPSSVVLSSNGLKLFLTTVQRGLEEYTLPTAFSTNSATFVRSFSLSGQAGSSVSGMTFSADGSSFIVCSNQSTQGIWGYTSQSSFIVTGYQPCISSNIDSTYWTDINSLTATNAVGDGNVLYAVSNDNKTAWSVLGNTGGTRDIVKNNGGTWQYNSNGTYAAETWANATTNTEVAALRQAMEGANTVVGFDISIASYKANFSLSAQDNNTQAVQFNTDGSKMFILGEGGNSVYEYSLSTSFDVTTSTYSQSFSIGSQETAATGLAFSPDGTKMFVCGFSGKDVNEYTLSTGFNISTASFVDSFNVSSELAFPYGLAFNNDGTKMFVCGQTDTVVAEYVLSTGFDVSTSSFSKELALSSQDNYPAAISFNNDGTVMFILGGINKAVYEYTLTTGFDVSTASFVSSFSVVGQSNYPRGMCFSNNGTKMFIVGASNLTVSEYISGSESYTNQMNSTTLNAITDANQITLGNDLDFAAILYYASGSTVPTYSGTAINYDAAIVNQGAVLGTDYTFDAPAGNKVRITAVGAGNYKVRVV